ncbi:SIR2 family protein [candidate division KSB1 bacterium]|nr:SIR2 family protein [candidate division KSB1 bacterium]
MSRLFIIGAGFSKALADAPLAKGLVKKIYENTLHSNKNYVSSGTWENDRNCFWRILNYLHESTTPLIDFLEKDGRKIINRDFDNFINEVNVEFLCSLLDLHIKHCFVPKAIEGDMKGCPIPFMRGFFKDDLRSALQFTVHHMLELLLPENLNPNSSAIDKMSNFIKAGDNIVTFNYDLLVEQMLWKRGLWNPFDGYGFEFETGGNNEFPETKVQVLKVHGSINWRSPDAIFHRNLELAITHPHKDESLFEGLKIPKDGHSKREFLQYPLYSHVLYPSFTKTQQYIWETDLIRKSVSAAETADEVFMLGYSFPEADPIANMIFTKMKKDVLLKAVLWDENQTNLIQRITRQYGFDTKYSIYENSRIEKWIENNFEYVNYKEDQKRVADMNALLNLKKKGNFKPSLKEFV